MTLSIQPDLGAATGEARPSATSTAGNDADLAAQLRSVFGSRFQILRRVAVGGRTSVFQMRHRLHDGLFAAKVLHPELAEAPGAVAAFRQEANHAARLGNHPNAVPIFDFGELDGLFFLVMPYVDGADLDRILLKAGPLSREETLQLAAQVCSVLCCAESMGVVHGAINPGNIRLDIYGQYRLLDFGRSQAPGPQRTPFRKGTARHGSPEQLAGMPLDTRSDLYTLGAVLCECLTGKPAMLEGVQQRHAEDWQMPNALHEGDPFRRLLTKLLSVDPADRPESAYELSGILDAMGWARPEFRPGPLDKRPFLRASDAQG